MKKYFLVILLLLLYLIDLPNHSYAYPDCANTIVYPQELNTNNLKDYLNNAEYQSINYICSYDDCFHPYNTDKNIIVNNLIELVNQTEEEKLYNKYKGIGITKISFDTCL